MATAVVTAPRAMGAPPAWPASTPAVTPANADTDVLAALAAPTAGPRRRRAAYPTNGEADAAHQAVQQSLDRHW
ncbi:hypothetical protein [Luedemannella helvata]